MTPLKFYLRNMISRSCIQLLEMKLQMTLGVKVLSIRLGEVVVEVEDEDRQTELEQIFDSLGFPVVNNADTLIAEQAKVAAVELIHYANNSNSLIRNSDYISDKLQMPYEKISKVFSKVTGNTLEKYIIQLKIEKAKELISGSEFTLSEIAYMLGYSSVQYLSNQFKKTTGVTVSEFKDNPQQYRIPIEEL